MDSKKTRRKIKNPGSKWGVPPWQDWPPGHPVPQGAFSRHGQSQEDEWLLADSKTGENTDKR